MNRFTELLSVFESDASNRSLDISGKRRDTVIEALSIASKSSSMSHNRRALAYAQILVTTWQIWDDQNEDILDDVLRCACEGARTIDMHQVDGRIASPLNYFVGAYLDGHNPEDLTYCEMMDGMQTSIQLMRTEAAPYMTGHQIQNRFNPD
jgi:hypothetical protein